MNNIDQKTQKEHFALPFVLTSSLFTKSENDKISIQLNGQNHNKTYSRVIGNFVKKNHNF